MMDDGLGEIASSLSPLRARQPDVHRRAWGRYGTLRLEITGGLRHLVGPLFDAHHGAKEA